MYCLQPQLPIRQIMLLQLSEEEYLFQEKMELKYWAVFHFLTVEPFARTA